jgi:mannose-6-phosphate isomerase-like protein (cupin superfamily)
MSDDQTFRLSETPVHLGLGATVVVQESFTGTPDWYELYGERHAADGSEGRLVSMHTFNGPWASWEMHPNGEELVVCTSGTFTLHQEVNGDILPVTLTAGEAVVNAPGVWHTADATGPVTALFITAGLGTEVRPR